MSETRRCPVATCHAPEISCSIGNSNLRECAHWMSAQETPADEVNQNEQPPNSTELRFPWTGNAMGVSDLPYLAGSAATRLLTMVGAADAGKTSLLAAFYLLIGRGITPDNVTFAGSLSLEGWENIAGSLRWRSCTLALQDRSWKASCFAYLPEAAEDFRSLDEHISQLMDVNHDQAKNASAIQGIVAKIEAKVIASLSVTR